MRRLVGSLIVSLSLLLTSFSASACRTGVYGAFGQANYDRLRPDLKDEILSKNGYVAIVRAKLVREVGQKQTGSVFNGKTKVSTPLYNKRRFYEIKYELVEMLHGDFPELPVLVSVPYSDEGMMRETQRSSHRKQFDFWDTFDIGHPYEFETEGMKNPDGTRLNYCGADEKKSLNPNSLYIIFGTENFGPAAGPIAPINDPFVQKIKGVISGINSPLDISAKDYFSKFSSYDYLVVDTCNVNTHAAMTTSIMAKNLNKEHIFWRDLAPYLDVSLSKEYLCKVGDQYLVLARDPGPRSYGVILAAPQIGRNPVHRFIPVRNGMINPKDILTNYNFSSFETISVELAMSWIQ